MQDWKRVLWGVAWAWVTPPTLIVTLHFNCRSSLLFLTIAALYCPYFYPFYTLYILTFAPSLKRNEVPPGCYSATGSTIGNNALKSPAVSPFLVDIHLETYFFVNNRNNHQHQHIPMHNLYKSSFQAIDNQLLKSSALFIFILIFHSS